mmetsp:Transcript_41367/g.111046  ORF Transcript_41367/g.111046 Transcript_41367/m.111046 type:complete len:96 (+) Transcript_41367:1-288(+)
MAPVSSDDSEEEEEEAELLKALATAAQCAALPHLAPLAHRKPFFRWLGRFPRRSKRKLGPVLDALWMPRKAQRGLPCKPSSAPLGKIGHRRLRRQ